MSLAHTATEFQLLLFLHRWKRKGKEEKGYENAYNRQGQKLRSELSPRGRRIRTLHVVTQLASCAQKSLTSPLALCRGSLSASIAVDCSAACTASTTSVPVPDDARPAGATFVACSC